jgi:hypothetical protein
VFALDQSAPADQLCADETLEIILSDGIEKYKALCYYFLAQKFLPRFTQRRRSSTFDYSHFLLCFGAEINYRAERKPLITPQ